jgi:hypothetical protein
MLTTSPTVEKISASNARTIGANFAAEHFGDQIGVGMPWHIVSALRSAWATPLVLTSPGYGIVGIVGLLLVDEEMGQITAWTTVEEVKASATQLLKEKNVDLESAFKRLVTPAGA